MNFLILSKESGGVRYRLNPRRAPIHISISMLGVIWCGFAGAGPSADHPKLRDENAIPHIDQQGRQGYVEFLDAPRHRAFAIGPGGAWSWRSGLKSAAAAQQAALDACAEHSEIPCLLYAVDDELVFDRKAWGGRLGPYLSEAAAARASPGAKRGQRFPDLVFADEKAKQHKLSELRGKVVVLHFWGTWCPPCRHELPDLAALHQSFANRKDVTFVFLQAREPIATSRAWLAKQGLAIPLYDSGSSDAYDDVLKTADGKDLSDRDVAPIFPSTYVLDRNGIVVFRRFGPAVRWNEYAPLILDVALRSGN